MPYSKQNPANAGFCSLAQPEWVKQPCRHCGRETAV